MLRLATVGSFLGLKAVAVSGFALISLSLNQASAQNMKIKLEDQAEISVPLSVSVAANGNTTYACTKIIQEVSNGVVLNHKITCNYALAGSNIGAYNETVYNGFAKIETDASTPGKRNFTVTVSFPPTGEYMHSAIKGAGSVKLNSNADGGQLNGSDQPTGTSLLRIYAIGQNGQENGADVIFCPFNMQCSGAGTSTFPFQLQNQCQYQPPVSMVSSVGMKIRAKISAGDKATFTLMPVSAVPPCPSDFNGDGKVDGVDLGHFLGKWGCVNNGMECDLNADFQINAADFSILLTEMGPCS